MLKLKELNNLENAWLTILSKLNKEGRDLHTVSNHPRRENRWFHASSDNNCILIERAKDFSKNCKINGRYPIRQEEFELIAKFYNSYAKNDSNKIRKTDSHMSSYIITLISELL